MARDLYDRYQAAAATLRVRCDKVPSHALSHLSLSHPSRRHVTRALRQGSVKASYPDPTHPVPSTFTVSLSLSSLPPSIGL